MVKKNQYDTEIHIPPRDWKKNWWAYAGHFLTAGIAGIAVGSGMPAAMAVGITYTGLYATYQCVEFARRKDTPARDISDYMSGFGLFGGSTLIYQFFM